MLVTPQLDIYYFNTPYLRTSSTLYNLDSMSSEIHLTNNCQQKHFGEYSKYEEGNTIPMKETLLAYFATLPESQGQEADILNSIVGKMKEIIIDTLMSARVIVELIRNFSTGAARRNNSNFLDMIS